MVEARDWVEIEEGRSAVLRLQGVSGRLDIFVTYLATGAEGKSERRVSLRRIADKMQPRESVLSIWTRVQMPPETVISSASNT